MDLLLLNLILFVLLLLPIAVLAMMGWTFVMRRLVVFEHERAVIYHHGKVQRVVGSGQYWYSRFSDGFSKLDLRLRALTIPGQEVLSADNVGLKISLAVMFKIADPLKAITASLNFQETLYLLLQLQLRDLVAAQPVDDLLAKRAEIATLLLTSAQPKAAELGLELVTVGLKDIMFPGELKNIFAQVVNARHEGLAALERARGESAALRNLANTAKLLERNPALLQLRLLQAVQSGTGNTIVLKMPGDAESDSPVVE